MFSLISEYDVAVIEASVMLMMMMNREEYH